MAKPAKKSAKAKPAKAAKAKAKAKVKAKAKAKGAKPRKLTGPRAVRLLTKAARRAWRATVSQSGWPKPKPNCPFAAKAVADGEKRAQRTYEFELKPKAAKKRAEADSLLSKADLLYREVCKVPSGDVPGVVHERVPVVPVVTPQSREDRLYESSRESLSYDGVPSRAPRHGKSRLHRT